MNGKEVVMIFPGEAIGSHIFPLDLAKSVNDYYRQKGVEVLTGEVVAGMEMRQSKTVLKIHAALKPKASGRSRLMVWWRASVLSLTSS